MTDPGRECKGENKQDCGNVKMTIEVPSIGKRGGMPRVTTLVHNSYIWLATPKRSLSHVPKAASNIPGLRRISDQNVLKNLGFVIYILSDVTSGWTSLMEQSRTRQYCGVDMLLSPRRA